MDKFLAFLKLVRFPNLVMLALVQVITVVSFYPAFPFNWFFVITLATVFIAASGYIINNIQDFELDKINKKNTSFFSKEELKKIYKMLIIISLMMVIYISTLVNVWIVSWFVSPIFILWFYAYFFSKYKLIGNILISFLVAESILIIPIFLHYHQDFLPNSNIILLDYALFAFLFNWIREIIKDIEDIKGDKTFDRKTIPILIGINKTKVFVALIYSVASYFIWESNFYIQFTWMKIVFTTLITANLFLLFNANEINDFKRLSLLIKLTMLFGLLTPLLFYFS